ncbi:MAG: thiol reductant ABC exporter subunit CydD [Propioniciclava sp.]
MVGCLTAGLTLLQAHALAEGIAGVFAAVADGTDPTPLAWVIPTLAAAFGGKALLSWITAVLAHRAAADVKSTLRRDIMTARLRQPLDAPSSTSGLATLATQGLDALDGFYAKYLPQLALAATVPIIVGIAVATADLTSAIIIALTLPLIPVFMALVGWTTETRTQRRWHTQQRLARHFADLIAGLPTLQVFGRATRQQIGLTKTEKAHRQETMGTLRISFLSALVLELLATLSVAVVAVTVGFRVVAGDLDLATALFVLVLAPEAFLPVRQVGVLYHDAADGMAAAQSAFTLIERAEQDEAGGSGSREDVLAQLHRVGHTYPEAESPAVSEITLRVGPGEFIALTGPSGGGKTTVLHALAGFLHPSEGTVTYQDGPQRWRDRTAWVGQHPGMLAGTIADNVRLGDPEADEDAVRNALHQAGADELDPGRLVGDDAEGLSAGERRRVATARALLRLRAGADVLLLDEPTAGLDTATEATLLASLRRTGVAVVVVSHRPAVLASADRVLKIGEAS